MLQQRQKLHRGQFLRHGAYQQTKEDRRRRLCQQLTRAVVGDDSETQQRGRYPASQIAIGSDQRGSNTRCFQRVAERQRNRLGFLLLVGRRQAR